MSARNETGTSGRDLSTLRENELRWLSRWQELELPPYTGSVPPVGAPLPVSFLLSTSMAVLSLGKVLENVGEDLDEEGEQFFFKRSSRPLYDSDADAASDDSGKPSGDPP
ncbi:unnamed protein product [Prorocentrum cordatum]|uniref:Uncharacterized protein n=1 Tax=Prorocentrum cordatum TaxID=2364126 RepID=A0ABN9XNF9_9DINO|nr:unnamed protein product [Polarella glacialis]